MSSEIEQYQAAKSGFEAATKRCIEIAGIVNRAAVALRDWKKTMISNVSAGFPAEVALNRFAPSIDANEWVSAQDLAMALSDYHKAKTAMHNAYNAIPAGQRDVIVPPAD